MYRDKLRAAARLKTSGGTQSNNFWQSAILVIIGALISFVSSLTTNFYNSKNESKKVALEEKLKFEKDVAESISANTTATVKITSFASKLLLAQPDLREIGKFDKKQVDSGLQIFTNLLESLELRTLTEEFLSNSYVDSGVSKRLKSLDSMSLDAYFNVYVELISNRTKYPVDTLIWHIGRFSDQSKSLLPMYAIFMRDFHTAILK